MFVQKLRVELQQKPLINQPEGRHDFRNAKLHAQGIDKGHFVYDAHVHQNEAEAFLVACLMFERLLQLFWRNDLHVDEQIAQPDAFVVLS